MPEFSNFIRSRSLQNASLLRLFSILVIVSVLISPARAVTASGNPGFLTSQPSMLNVTAAGGSALPIITVGDTLPNGYRYEAIPDGIGLVRGEDDHEDDDDDQALDVFVTHETSLVPFPYTINTATNTATGLSDFDNSQVSKLKLDPVSAGVLWGEFAIDSSANYQRFCSGFVADEEHGFDRPVFFANEEATDFISPPPLQAWPPDTTNQRQAGLVVAYDTEKDKRYEIYGMGRLNHENTVVVPGRWKKMIVALTGDDTFSAPSSQMYMYIAKSDKQLLADKGSLFAFRVTGKNSVPVNPNDAFNGANDYGDIAVGDTLNGQFIPVPRDIAVGDQTPLEDWSNSNNVFQFIRIEDIAYDKNNPRVVYFADTGEPRAIASAVTGRLARGSSSTQGPYPNGRIFKMVLNKHDPTIVDSLTILYNADAGGYNNPAEMHNPDNVDTSKAGSLMIGEDPGGHNSSAPNAGPAARIWRYDLNADTVSVVAEVEQALEPAAREGSWESSGIVDASAIYGPGAWLVNIQAHTLFVETEVRTVIDTSRTPNITATLTFKREGGQLLLIKIPGS